MADITELTDPNAQAFPKAPNEQDGMTMREYLVASILSGMVARANVNIGTDRAGEFAELAVIYADAVFDYLEANEA